MEKAGSTVSRAALKELRAALGKRLVCTDPVSLAVVAGDATRIEAQPEILIYPETEEHVAAALAICTRYVVPVVARGAGTGLTGGAIPLRGGVVLDFSRMNRILRVHPQDQLACVEPGVVVSDLNNAIASDNLFFPPDPASSDSATIGGAIAECAGGLRAFKYGVTREYVLGLHVALTSGELLRLGGRPLKNVTGYDLMRLFVGSEGTLGVITQATLRLRRLPEHAATVLAGFAAPDQALSAANNCIDHGLVPRAVEFMDHHAVRAVVEHTASLDTALDPDCSYLLIEYDGWRESVAREVQETRGVLDRAGTTQVVVADTADQRESLWAVRRSISPALYRLKPDKINEDVCFPRSALVQAWQYTQELSSKHDVLIASFGHVGDGNLHVNILYDRTDTKQRARAEAAAHELMEFTLTLDGVLSGEHGIGITKQSFITLQLGPDECSVMQRLKDLLDTQGILNPGKIFP